MAHIFLARGVALTFVILAAAPSAYALEAGKRSDPPPLAVAMPKPWRMQVDKPETLNALSPTSGSVAAVPAASSANLFLDVVNPSHWTPYVGAGAVSSHASAADRYAPPATYQFMAGTTLRIPSASEDSLRSHELTLGYRYLQNETLPGAGAYSSASGLNDSRPDHRVGMDWKLHF